MKRLFLLFSLIIYFFSSSAQTIKLDKGELLGLKANKLIIIDTANIRVRYKQYIINDTIDINSKKSNLMILQIGEKVSKYTDYNALIGDSIITNYIKNGDDINTILQKTSVYIKGSSRENIFKNYPKEQITTTNLFAGSSYLYEEPSVNIKWKLETGNLTVNGYKCKKATTTLFGRNYTAWYTPDIPISNGPWKFSGLPGLILKVEDDKKQISFECIALEKPSWVDQIYINESNYMKTNKKTFLKLYKQYKENPGAALQNSGMIQGEIPAKAFRKRAYNPIELSE